MKPGSYTGGVIILLSDGRRTTGPDPLDIAKMAADRGVRVYTVGFGTRDGASIDFEGYSFYVRLDEETLKAIARITGGEYFHAGTAADLRKVYETLNARIALETRETEVSALLAAGAVALLLVAALLSLLWFHRGLPMPARADPRSGALRPLAARHFVEITTSRSVPDSAPHASPGRPSICRTCAFGLSLGKRSNFSVRGSKRRIALVDHSVSHTLSWSST